MVYSPMEVLPTEQPKRPAGGARQLDEARAAFGDAVKVTEPFIGQPPLWIEPTDRILREDINAAARWMIDHRDAIEQALLTFGAILWRGFPVAASDDFSAVMSGFTPFSKGYVAGTSERKAIKGNVMEATRTPEEVYIFLHQEMSYQTFSPRLVAFYCRQPSPQGGNTLICDMRGVLEALPEQMQRRFKEGGVIYGRNFRNEEVQDWRLEPAYRHHSWQHWFGTHDPATVAAQLDEREISYEWAADGSLRYWTHRPSVATHPITEELLLFNQLHAQTQHRLCLGDEYADLMDSAYGSTIPRPYFVTFGDGEPLNDAEFFAIHDELERRRVVFDWHPGDIMIVENKLTGHGRTPYRGPRDIQVMLFE